MSTHNDSDRTISTVRRAYPSPMHARSSLRVARMRMSHSSTPPVTAEGMVAERDLDEQRQTSIGKVLVTMVIALGLVLIFGASGLVHSAKGMPDGPERQIALAAGDTLLSASKPLHLTAPWDSLQAALGRSQQPAIAPLLASVPPAARPRHLAAGPPAPPVPPSVPTNRGGGGQFAIPAAIPRSRMLQRKTHTPAVLPPLHRPTRANPMRLLVTGDSLTGYIGPQLIDLVSHHAPVRGFVDTHDGTGLTRPDYVDWSVVARQQVAADHPNAVVIMMGGNDFQNMTLPGGKFFLAGTPAWTREYQRRAAICMRIWAQSGHARVYWLSIPPARDPAWAHDDMQINIALRRAAATVPGARFVDILGPVTNHGAYTDFVNTASGPLLVREPDGVHLNIAGSQIVANEVLDVLRHQWHLR
jgi:uncharacterized protein